MKSKCRISQSWDFWKVKEEETELARVKRSIAWYIMDCLSLILYHPTYNISRKGILDRYEKKSMILKQFFFFLLIKGILEIVPCIIQKD